jgi:hypothetical protein
VDEASVVLDYSTWKSFGAVCENGASSFIFALFPKNNFAKLSGI